MTKDEALALALEALNYVIARNYQFAENVLIGDAITAIKQAQQAPEPVESGFFSQEAYKAHAWHIAQELDTDQSGLFTGIAGELKAHMQKLNLERQKNGG